MRRMEFCAISATSRPRNGRPTSIPARSSTTTRTAYRRASEDGIPLLNVAVRSARRQPENLLVTDFTGTANFNETFPLFSWYVVETDTTRYKNTGTHVVTTRWTHRRVALLRRERLPAMRHLQIGKFLANTQETVSLPANLSVPGAVYCDTADCTGSKDVD